MQIRRVDTLDLHTARTVAALYNAQVRSLPCDSTATPEEFQRGARYAWSVWSEGLFDHADLTQQCFLIAGDQGCAHGFVHIAKWERVSEHAREELGADATFAGAEAGVVRFLAFDPGEPRTGQSLLEAAERWFRSVGLRDVYLAYPYGFLRAGHAWLMSSMGHVCALFGINGYEAHERGVALRLADLETADFETVEMGPPPGVTTSFETKNSGAEGSLADLHVELRRGPTKVGSAYVQACGRLSSAAEAQQVYDLLWYNVQESERGRGSGKYLLDTTLREAWARGSRTMLCYTHEDNHVALRLYAAAGFKVDALTYALSKQLGG